MLKIIGKRLVVVCLQFVFIHVLAINISIADLGSYYGILALCIVPLSLFSTVPEYIFNINLSQNKIRRNVLVVYAGISLIILTGIFILGLLADILAVATVAYLLIVYVSQLIRNYINVFKLTEAVMNNQIFEQILKLIFLSGAILNLTISTESLFFIQFFATFSAIIYLLVRLHKRGCGLYGQSKFSFSITLKDALNVTLSSFVNISFVNSLKIYLNFSGQLGFLALIGIAQQIFGVAAQNINTILQIQYGNLILMNKKHVVSSFRPTLLLLGISMIGILIISHSLRFILPFPIQDMDHWIFISIFLLECYIIPLSYLSKLYTAFKNTNRIVKLHLAGLGVPLMLAIWTGLFSNEKVFIGCLMTGSAILFINYYSDYKKIQSTIER